MQEQGQNHLKLGWLRAGVILRCAEECSEDLEMEDLLPKQRPKYAQTGLHCRCLGNAATARVLQRLSKRKRTLRHGIRLLLKAYFPRDQWIQIADRESYPFLLARLDFFEAQLRDTNLNDRISACDKGFFRDGQDDTVNR